MAYNSNLFITNNHTNYIDQIRKNRDLASKGRDPKAREKINELNKQKEDFILITPEKLLNFYEQLKEDPLLKTPKSQLMLKNLALHLDKVSKYVRQ